MRWFHKQDGGLIKVDDYPWPYCSVCEYEWMYFGFWGKPATVPPDPDWVHFSKLPEDLQAAALAEML